MLNKFGLFLAGLVVAGFGFAPGGNTADAASLPARPTVVPPSASILDPVDHWRLRLSIIEAAADTIGVPVRVVYEGLEHGLSLDDIAYLNGMHEEVLERGILQDEHADLARLVRDDKISLHHAEEIMAWLRNHIDGIVRHHGDFDSELDAE